MERRRFVTAAASTVLLTGCLHSGNESGPGENESGGGGDSMEEGGESEETSGDGTGEDLEPPAEDAAPEELLPVATDGWERTETGPQPEGEAGIYGVYEKEGVEGYQVAVIRWVSEEKAVEEADTFESYAAITYVVLGKFSFIAYDNGSGEEPYGLLGQSSALTAEYAENNDIIS